MIEKERNKQQKEEKTKENLITIEELIERAKKEGVNFGKGEPYNRLRYYTKMGWIPHMKRKGKNVKGHYPEWVIDRLKTIEELRKKGIYKEKIIKEIERLEKKEIIKKTYFKPQNKKVALLLAGILFIVILILDEIDILQIGKDRKDLIPLQRQESIEFP